MLQARSAFAPEMAGPLQPSFHFGAGAGLYGLGWPVGGGHPETREGVDGRSHGNMIPNEMLESDRPPRNYLTRRMRVEASRNHAFRV